MSFWLREKESLLGSWPLSLGRSAPPFLAGLRCGDIFLHLFIFLNCGKHIPCDAPKLSSAGEGSEKGRFRSNVERSVIRRECCQDAGELPVPRRRIPQRGLLLFCLVLFFDQGKAPLKTVPAGENLALRSAGRWSGPRRVPGSPAPSRAGRSLPSASPSRSGAGGWGSVGPRPGLRRWS